MEESFLLLEEKEHSRALNILQSSVNKLLHFVGDADIISASLSVSDAGLSVQENKSKQNLPTCSQDFQTGSRNGDGKKAVVRGRKKPACRPKKKAARRNGSAAFSDHDESGRNRSAESLFASTTASVQSRDVSRAAPALQACEKAKHENKDNFDDDLQELADFDCTYDFNPNLQHSGSEAVSRAGVGHMTQCGGKFPGKMLSMSAGTSDENVCVTSGTQPQYPAQMLDVSASQEGGHCEISHSHYGGQILSTAASDIKANCHLSHASQYGAPQIMSGSQMDSGGGEAQRYSGGVLDSSGDHSQYGGGVMDSGGGPSQYAGGVIDSSGDPSQYAGGVIDASGESSQYAGGGVIDSTGETSQYAGGVIDMSVAQEVQNCDPSHAHAQYTGAMIPTAQDVTVSTTSQYGGTVLAMSMPETVSYSHSGAHYSHTIMQGLNCAATPPQFTDTVLDMSTAASRQCESGISASHLPAHYAGTIFEGAVIGTQAGAACNPFQFRRPVFEPHEAFHRSQDLTQSLMHASMLQQQQLYQLHHQSMTSRWRTFVCRGCGESLTHYRSVRAHLLTHGSSPLSCRFCRQQQVNHIALLHHLCGGQHWKQSANVSREIYMCHECSKFFTSKPRLRSHFETEHNMEMPGDIKYMCRFCGLQLSRKLSMFLHYRQHAGGRFVCRLCGAILNDFVQYASHMADHDRRRKKRTCRQCGEVFRCHQSLMHHIKTHPGHTCDLCQKVCSSQAALSRHQSKAHNINAKSKVTRSRTDGGRQCGICHKQFPRAKDLELHSHLHTGRVFLCLRIARLIFFILMSILIILEDLTLLTM